jgi:hypothetical protein
MMGRSAQLLSIAFVALHLAGCASAKSRFYTLEATARPDGTPAAIYAVVIGPVSVPASVDRPQFVVQVAPNRVVLDEFNRWAAPLDDGIARVIAGNLGVLLGTPRVATAPFAGFASPCRVAIDVQRFESVPGDTVVIEAVWTVRGPAEGAVRVGRSVVREPAEGGGFDALAAAHSRALARVSDDIATAIRATAEKKP